MPLTKQQQIALIAGLSDSKRQKLHDLHVKYQTQQGSGMKGGSWSSFLSGAKKILGYTAKHVGPVILKNIAEYGIKSLLSGAGIKLAGQKKY